MAVVAVKISAFLVAVEGIVGGVEVNDDFPGFPRDGFDSLCDDEVFDGFGIGHDFPVARVGCLGGKFETVERGVGCEGLAVVLGIAAGLAFEIGFPDREGEGGIATEVVVVVEILVA